MSAFFEGATPAALEVMQKARLQLPGAKRTATNGEVSTSLNKFGLDKNR